MGMTVPHFVPSMKPTPLAVQLRPKTLTDIVGQCHLIGPDKPLTKMAEKSKFLSTILWGSPGSGKTSLVRVLAQSGGANFEQLNATDAKVADVRKVIAGAEASDKQTIVFIDEIHRFSKNQIDVLLPAVEDGVIILFGATTENPKFAVNNTLLSRCLVLELKPLDKEALLNLIMKVKAHYKGLGKIVKIDIDPIKRLINRVSGDARKLITALETIIEILLPEDGMITTDLVDMAIPDKHLVFDASGNDHFDLAHCYQEAIQNSDTNAAIYWLAKWISSGEDAAYICRRMLITAFEDCSGNPYAITTAAAACFATERTGLPECMIPMAQATVEMSKSKRNKTAYVAIKAAMEDVKNKMTIHVPPELRAGSHGYVPITTRDYMAMGNWKRDCDSLEPS